MSSVQTAVALALAVGAAADIIAKAKISARPRAWLARQPQPVLRWLSGMVHCPLCVGVWLSLAVTAVYLPRLAQLFYLLDLLVTSLAITAAAMLVVAWIKLALGR